MLQLPDFIQKQIVIIDPRNGTSINDLKFKNENIVLYKDGTIINQVSIHKIFAVFIIGEMTITSVLIKKVKKCGISIFLLNRNFEEYAAICAQAEGNYLLRHNQYHFVDDLNFSKNLVKNKCHNQLILLKEQSSELFKNKSRLQQYKEIAAKIDQATSMDQLLGIEGSVSKNYFNKYFHDIGWYKRMPRSKVDMVNVLLDIGYNMLFNFIDSLLRLHGFDTYKGIYHQLFFQRKSLSCDIMEPFRVLIDRALMKAFHLGQLDERDFTLSKGQYLLKIDQSRKYVRIFLDALMDSKEDIFVYVKGFYFCILNQKQEYPFFKLK